MNYSVLMAGGLTVFLTAWYLWKRNHGYVGPRVVLEAANNDVMRAASVSMAAAAEARMSVASQGGVMKVA